MSRELQYEKLGVALSKDSSGNFYEYGVVIDGAFVALGSVIAGHVDPVLEEAKRNKTDSGESSGS